MLTITYNNHNIPVDEGFSMRFSWVNPACYFDKIPGAVGLGIEIPVNDYSQAIFGSPNRFEKYISGSDRKFSGVDIRFNGVLLMSGVLNITSANSETYSAWLQSYMGAIGEEQREKFITDLDWDDTSLVDQVLENKGSFEDDTDNYCTGEITNKKFWEEIGKEIEEDEEYYNDNGELDTRPVTITQTKVDHRDNFDYEVNADNNGIAKVSGNGCVVSPFLFLRFVLKHIFKVNEYFIDSTRDAFSVLTGYQNLALYNNYNIMQPVMTTETKYVYVTDPITGDRHINGVEIIKNISWELREFNYLQLVPMVNIGEFLLGIQNMLNVVFLFGMDHRVAIIDREACLTGTPIDLTSYFSGEWIIGDRKDLSLKFVTEFDKNDSIFADNYHDLSDRRGDFKDNVLGVDDLEDIASPEYGEIRHVLWGDDWYEYKWDVDSNYDEDNLFAEFDKVGWAFASCGPQPMFYGTGDEIEEIKTCISTLYRRNDLIYLTAMQKGSIKQMRNTWNNFSPRLLFHLGYNTVDVVNSEELTSLRWDGTDGLLEMRWKNWAAFWANRLSVEADFNLPLNVLYYVINNITNKFKTQEGEFIIEEMEVEFGLHVIGKTHIKGYKV